MTRNKIKYVIKYIFQFITINKWTIPSYTLMTQALEVQSQFFKSASLGVADEVSITLAEADPPHLREKGNFRGAIRGTL